LSFKYQTLTLRKSSLLFKKVACPLFCKGHKIIESFFEYAKELNREEIEAIATDAEMSVAFQEVIKVTFPLAESPMKVMERMSQ